MSTKQNNKNDFDNINFILIFFKHSISSFNIFYYQFKDMAFKKDKALLQTNFAFVLHPNTLKKCMNKNKLHYTNKNVYK